MNKKGFTLVEIVVCISLLAIIGVGSFVGIRLVDKHIKITKLQQMSDKILQAANVYLETDKEANKELYTNKNGVIIPVRKLVNEGLIDVGNINLNDKTDYVIALLGSEDSNSKCTGVYTATEWDLGSGKTIYICTDSNGTSNLATIDPTKYNNKTYVSNEPYYFKGRDPNNYVKLTYRYNNTGSEREDIFRIIYIDRNDDIIIQSQYKYYVFSVAPKKVSSAGLICMTDSGVDNQKFYNISGISGDYNSRVSSSPNIFCSSWLGGYTGDSYDLYINRLTNVKIISGTGAEDNPFILENKS